MRINKGPVQVNDPDKVLLNNTHVLLFDILPEAISDVKPSMFVLIE
jgi:hypothetical protein